MNRPNFSHLLRTFIFPFIFPFLFLFFFFFGQSQPLALAGEISLRFESRISVTGPEVDIRYTLRNLGTDAAQNPSVSARFLGQEKSSLLAPSLSPGKGGDGRFRFMLPEDAKPGAYPVFFTLTYTDENGISFSNAALGVARTRPGVSTRLSLNADWEAGENRIRLGVDRVERVDRVEAVDTVEGGGAVEGEDAVERGGVVEGGDIGDFSVRITAHLPDDLSVDRDHLVITFEEKDAPVFFRIDNRSGLPGSRYQIFFTAEYEAGGVHYLAYASPVVPVDDLSSVRKIDFDGLREKGFFGLILLAGVIGGLLLVSGKIRSAFSGEKYRVPLLFDLLVILMIQGFILSCVSPQFLITDTITTGGDTASHYYTLHYLQNELLPDGKIGGWTPGNLAGFPILQFYFPLPFLFMSFLDIFLPLTVAFKWGTLLGTFLLPVGAYLMLRLMRAPFPAPAIGAVLTLPFLFNSANSMWGGNILSTLAGEFSYSLSLALMLIFLGTLYRGCRENRWVILNGIGVFFVGFSHGYTLLFAEALSLFFLITPHDFIRRFFYLAKVYALGFFLLAFWLVPLLVFTKYTTAYHTAWQIYSIKEVIPDILVPTILLATISMIGFGAYAIYRFMQSRKPEGKHEQKRPEIPFAAPGFLLFGIFIAGIMYMAAPRLGVVDIRYIPCGQLMAAQLAALGLGALGLFFNRWGIRPFYLLLILLAGLYWTDHHEEKVTEWTQWNYSGFEAKPAWPLFRKINSSIAGDFTDPRVVFEHSSHHNVFGTTRAFESLPLFAGRATLEGVYMQATVTSPFIFYIQSEVSKEKSCPFSQYVCADLNFDRALERLEMFNVSTLILRSTEAKAAAARHPGLELDHRFGEYEIWKLRNFENRYVVPLDREPVLLLTEEWKIDAYKWFMDDDLIGIPVIFAADLSDVGVRDFNIATTLSSDMKTASIPGECSVKETITNDEIRIETDCTDRPLLVKVSYHPNWKVKGAERIYLAGPAFMLIYPEENSVRLYYGNKWPKLFGTILTAIGILILLMHLPIPFAERRLWTYVPGASGLVGIEPEKRFPWNPSPNIRWFLLLSAATLAILLMVGWSIHIYRIEPSRLFNRAIHLKDAKEFDEARDLYEEVIDLSSPVSNLAAESAYYIAICYYLEGKNPEAISAFELFIRIFRHANRIAEAHYHIGLLHFRMKETGKGIERMRFVMERFPTTAWAGYAEEQLGVYGPSGRR